MELMLKKTVLRQQCVIRDWAPVLRPQQRPTLALGARFLRRLGRSPGGPPHEDEDDNDRPASICFGGMEDVGRM